MVVPRLPHFPRRRSAQALPGPKRLYVLVEPAVLATTGQAWNTVSALNALLSVEQDLFDVDFFDETGPQEGAETRSIGGHEYPIRRVVVHDKFRPDDSWRRISRISGPSSVKWSEIDDTDDTSLLLARIAKQFDAAVVVSGRRFSRRAAATLGRCVLCTPDEALVLVTLWLRARSVHPLILAPKRVQNVNKGHYFRLALSALLPSFDSWMSALVTHPSGPALRLLSTAVQSRLGRALQLRDAAFIAASRSDADAFEDLLLAFESGLLFLQGAFDALARAVHLHFELDGEPQWAAWDKRGWRHAVKEADPGIASLLAEKYVSVFNIVSKFRNLIHGPDYSGHLLDGNTRRRYLRIADEDVKVVGMAAKQAGGHHAWGISDRLGSLYAEPAALFDRAFEVSISWAEDMVCYLSGGAKALPFFPDLFDTQEGRLAAAWSLGLATPDRRATRAP